VLKSAIANDDGVLLHVHAARGLAIGFSTFESPYVTTGAYAKATITSAVAAKNPETLRRLRDLVTAFPKGDEDETQMKIEACARVLDARDRENEVQARESLRE
jgi:hypothetical protein